MKLVAFWKRCDVLKLNIGVYPFTAQNKYFSGIYFFNEFLWSFKVCLHLVYFCAEWIWPGIEDKHLEYVSIVECNAIYSMRMYSNVKLLLNFRFCKFFRNLPWGIRAIGHQVDENIITTISNMRMSCLKKQSLYRLYSCTNTMDLKSTLFIRAWIIQFTTKKLKVKMFFK